MGHDPLETGEQRFDLALAPIQPLRDQQPVRCVVRAQRKRVDAAIRLPFRDTSPQVRFHAGGGLVALLGGLGEELHCDVRQYRGDSRGPLIGGNRLPGDMAMHPFHRIGSGEGWRPRQHLVKRNAQRVQIAARIDRPVHPTGLLRCHIREGARDRLGRLQG